MQVHVPVADATDDDGLQRLHERAVEHFVRQTVRRLVHVDRADEHQIAAIADLLGNLRPFRDFGIAVQVHVAVRQLHRR